MLMKIRPEAYETLLQDVMEGNATLFMRADQVEARWKAVMPIWKLGKRVRHHPSLIIRLIAGDQKMRGALIARDGHNWITLPPKK